MSAEFARVYIRNLELAARSYEQHTGIHAITIAKVLREHITAIKKTMEELGHTL